MKRIKFSIIIPVYNTQKYIQRCLESVFNQTYENYEVIVVNDGSTDNSEEEIKSYKNIKYIKQKNKGLSSARNIGVKKATGDYIIFLDSDDSIESNLLEELNNKINNEDVVRYQLRIVNSSNAIPYKETSFSLLTGPEAFSKLCNYKYVENATLYAFKKDYWIRNNYSFPEGYYHEDFGLIPEVIYRAKKVSSFDIIGYNYYQNDDSIMSTKDDNKNEKKAYDVLDLGIKEIDNIKKIKEGGVNKAIFNSFVANSIFIKLKSLNNKNNKEFIKTIKENNLIDYLMADTLKRKIKKGVYKARYFL